MKRVLTDLRPLRASPAFRRLWLGSTLSSVGDALTGFALPLQVYHLTRSSLAVGAIGAVELAPTLVAGLLGGSIADRTDRRKLALLTTAGSALVSGGLAAQAVAGSGLLWLLYALAAAQSGLGAIGTPARRALVRDLLPDSRLAAGLALNRVGFQVMLTVGPALAGVIASWPELGLRACYAFDGASFAGSLAALTRLPSAGAAPAGALPSLPGVLDGIRFLRHSQPVAGALLADLTATVLGLPVALFPALNAERFGGHPVTLGLFSTAVGAGGLLGAVCSRPLGRLSRPGLAMLASVGAWGAAMTGFAAVRGLAPTLLFLAVAGGTDTVTVVLRGTIVQATTPEVVRGRVTATEYVVGASGSQLGNLDAGAVGSLTSPATSAASGGLATIAVALALALLLPGFARHRTAPDRVGPSVPGPADLAEGAAVLGDVAGVVAGEEEEAAHHRGHR